MNHIYISYSKKDEYEVSGLAALLGQVGIDIWKNTSDEDPDLSVGSTWFEKTECAMYDAIGAIIIHSENRKDQESCLIEYDMITNNSLPYLIIDINELNDKVALIDKIQKWYKDYVDRSRNRDRAIMFSQAYHYSRNKAAFHQMLKKKKLGDAIAYYSDLSKYLRLLEKEGYTYNNKQADELIKDYISKVKHKIMVSQLVKASIAISGVAAVLIVCLIVRALPIGNANISSAKKQGHKAIDRTSEVEDGSINISYKDSPEGAAYIVDGEGSNYSEDGDIPDNSDVAANGSYIPKDSSNEDSGNDDPEKPASDTKVDSTDELYSDDEPEGILFRDTTGSLAIADRKEDIDRAIAEGGSLSSLEAVPDEQVQAADEKNVTGNSNLTPEESAAGSNMTRTAGNEKFPVSPVTNAKSESGNLTAYGYADGSILIVGSEKSDDIYVINTIQESIVALYFSDSDSKLYAIGKSGTTYKADLNKPSGVVDNEKLHEYWNNYLRSTRKGYGSKWGLNE